MTRQILFLFPDMAKTYLTEARYRKYCEWVNVVENARRGNLKGRSTQQANQYDKAEELITWNTFAPLLKMKTAAANSIVAELIKVALFTDASEYVDGKTFSIEFERLLPSPSSYLKHLAGTVKDHPVRYVRESARGKKLLEWDTHVDISLENSRLLVLVEMKFTSDISCQVRYDPNRNQLARLTDAGIDAAGDKKLVVLLVSPSRAFSSKSRLYYYKVTDYQNSIENLKADLPHRDDGEIAKILGVGWVSLKQVASTIQGRAIDPGL